MKAYMIGKNISGNYVGVDNVNSIEKFLIVIDDNNDQVILTEEQANKVYSVIESGN